jgi:hypothetical protein
MFEMGCSCVKGHVRIECSRGEPVVLVVGHGLVWEGASEAGYARIEVVESRPNRNFQRRDDWRSVRGTGGDRCKAHCDVLTLRNQGTAARRRTRWSRRADDDVIYLGGCGEKSGRGFADGCGVERPQEEGRNRTCGPRSRFEVGVVIHCGL